MPPALVTLMAPVTAPVGTTTRRIDLERTCKLVTATRLPLDIGNDTPVVPTK